MSTPRRLVVALTGASGAVYGMRLLQMLRAAADIEIHLLVTDAGELNLQQELNLSRHDIAPLAHVVHDVHNIGASIASGSFRTEGMVVAPCSMKTLAAVAHGHADNLVARTADVMLKERRRLVLMARETPLNLIHLRNMTAVTEAGGIIFPPVPSFYHRPQSLDQLVDNTVMRVLDLFGLCPEHAPVWSGILPLDKWA